MMKIKLLFIPLLVLFLFTSCATSYSAKYNEKGGYVVGSISLEDTRPRFDNYMILYQPSFAKPGTENVNVLTKISTSRGFASINFNNADVFSDDQAVYYFAEKLKPGKYYISFFEASDNNNQILSTGFGLIGGILSESLRRKNPLRVYYPFEVVENEITYLGDFYFDGKNKRDIQISNKKSVDMKLIDEKYPILKKYKVYNASFKYLKHH